MDRKARSQAFGIALIVAGVAAGVTFTLLLRKQDTPPAATTAAGELPSGPAASTFAATVANAAVAPGPTPEGMA